jgi:hypothetical protein
MNAYILPGLALTMAVYLAVCAWLVFRPEPIERKQRKIKPSSRSR